MYFLDSPSSRSTPQFADEPELGGQLLGIATFPQDAVVGDPLSSYCIIDAGTTPGGWLLETNQGKTATHEVGHWLGLMYTFSGGCSSDPAGGDFVADTPASGSRSEGCLIGRDSCPDLPGKDPIHNYMDYSDDECTTEFTPGQIMRMHAIWDKYQSPNSSSIIPKNQQKGSSGLDLGPPVTNLALLVVFLSFLL